ncbi:MAG: hypothetical protein II885_17600 [Oscillospiraceae bacterium]|nr:hypothetical protein [Oscillospiraceae bacterium]
MRGKGLTRLAAGTCSICICYALTMRSIRGESAMAEWTDRTALAVETAVPTPEAFEPRFPDQQGEISFDSNEGHGRNGHKGSRRGRSAFSYPRGSENEEEEKTAAGEKESDHDNSAPREQASGDPPTLSQFLSSLRCGGCRHNCSLFNPRCMKGRSKAQKAQTEYVQTYGSDF